MTHIELVRAIKKPGEKILLEMTPTQADLLHMAAGVAGEAGELLDAIKKHAIYQKPLDVKNVREELGDLEFYMAAIRDILSLSREEILQENINKLSARYPGLSYSNAAAIERKDKQ